LGLLKHFVAAKRRLADAGQQWSRRMNDNWYYMKSGKEHGPVTLESLRETIKSGELRSSDEVWRQGTPDWLPLRSVREVADLFPTQEGRPGATLQPLAAPEKPSPESTGDLKLAEGKTEPSPREDYQVARIYYAKLRVRLTGILLCIGLGSFGLAFLVFTVKEYRTDNPGRLTPGGMAVLACLLGGWTVVWWMSGIACLWLGRLVLQEGRARMPRPSLFPWGFLPLKEMPLRRVSGWGIGAETGGVKEVLLIGMPLILAFEVIDRRNTDRKTTMRLNLAAYPAGDAQQIYRYFEARLGKPAQLERHSLWGLRLANKRWD
jgi:hypothetical protein